MRLIDADALMQSLGITNMDCDKCAWHDNERSRCKRGGDFEDACFAIETEPTIIDATPVVRCKDCKYYKKSEVSDRMMCWRNDVDGWPVCYDFNPYDFCSYGERRSDG